MRVSAIALLIFAALSAQAEERCKPGNTPRQCVQRLITTRAYENAQAALAATNPGTSTVSSPTRSAVKDFLTAASAQVEGSSVKDSGTALILDYSFFKQFNFEATLPDPTPSPAASSIGSTAQLSRGDDVLVTLSYNLLTRYFGRNIDKSLFDSMLLGLASNAAPATAAVPATAYDTPFHQLFPDAATRIAAMADYEAAAIATLPAFAVKLGSDLADLANRQPQLFASGLYHHRAATVGPKERAFRLTWEIGTDNVNTFRDHEGRDCETRGDCLEAFTNFAARTVKRPHIGRLSIAAQYGKTALNEAGTFTEVPTAGLSYQATYGQDLSSFTGQPVHVDLSYSYDGSKTTHGFATPGLSAMPRRGAPFALDDTTIPPSSVHDSLALTITPSIGNNLLVPVSVVSVNHDDWFPSGGLNPFPISFPLPVTTHPAHVRERKKEIRVAMVYRVPPFRHTPPNPSCCCK